MPSPTPPVAYLSQALVEAIQSAYDKKTRPTESYKVHRVLISKLDDLVDDLRSSGDGEGAPAGQIASGVNPTADLAALVKLVVASSAKDAPSSLRYLWTGRPDDVGKKRREKEAVWSEYPQNPWVCGCGFLWVWVRVSENSPMGYPRYCLLILLS